MGKQLTEYPPQVLFVGQMGQARYKEPFLGPNMPVEKEGEKSKAPG